MLCGGDRPQSISTESKGVREKGKKPLTLIRRHSTPFIGRGQKPCRCVRKDGVSVNAKRSPLDYEERLVYPAYPQHSFSPWGLVHICIPQTGTPCGRVIGSGLTDSRGSFPLWDCLSLTCCIYCTTNLSVCQYLFLES